MAAVAKKEPTEDAGEVDIMERDDIRSTMLGILTANNLMNMTAAKARTRLEEEMEETFGSDEQKRKIRILIKRIFKENANKFSKYKPKPSPAKRSPKKAATKRKQASKSPPKKKAPKAAKMYDVSEPLQKIVKISRGERSEISKLLWAYIKEKDLQNPDKRTEIHTDDLLRAVCGGEEVITSLQVTKHISSNITISSDQTSNPTEKKEEASKAPTPPVVESPKRTSRSTAKVKEEPKTKENASDDEDSMGSDTDTDDEDFVQKKSLTT